MNDTPFRHELSFSELRTARQELRRLLEEHHLPSLDALKEEGSQLAFGGFTRTATCVESMLSRDPSAPIAREFAKSAFATSKAWHSDGAASVYCACRTLPVVLRFQEDATHASRATDLIRLIWSTAVDQQGRDGVRELSSGYDAWPSKPEPRDEFQEEAVCEHLKADSYPPNTFHTYWALRSAEKARQYLSHWRLNVGPIDRLSDKIRRAWVWSRSVIALQTALANGRSQAFDADQLGWALAIRLRWNPEDLTRSILDGRVVVAALTPPHQEERELLERGLEAYFGAQLPSGRWPTFAPLFHYPQAGNAYCYFFETLGELLRSCLRRGYVGEYDRMLLRPYLSHLLSAARYAWETAIPLNNGGRGWNSGHHPHRTGPQSWATASVYTFLQNLRKLLGLETRAVAARELQARRVDRSHITSLGERGETWNPDPDRPRATVGTVLATMFVHPVAANKPSRSHEDPDAPVLGKRGARKGRDWARSAILFGPPGTSKTSMVSGIAAAIDWPLVELHASHFLVDGHEQIPSRADWIFERLMELDCHVVLFDELDEMLRERNAPESDPFSRFLTTLMLPKLAELWKQRRLLFFLNTNLITTADQAIRRSERFDANILVETPSLAVKERWLKEAGIDADLSNLDQRARASMALVRYDQISTLASLLRNGCATVADALSRMFPDADDRVKQLQEMREQIQFDLRAERVVALKCLHDSAPNADTTDRGWKQIGSCGNVRYFAFDDDGAPLPDRLVVGEATFLKDAGFPGVFCQERAEENGESAPA